MNFLVNLNVLVRFPSGHKLWAMAGPIFRILERTDLGKSEPCGPIF